MKHSERRPCLDNTSLTGESGSVELPPTVFRVILEAISRNIRSVILLAVTGIIWGASTTATAPVSGSITVDPSTSLIHSGQRAQAIQTLLNGVRTAKPPQRKLLIQKSRVLARIFLTNKTFQLYQDGLNSLNAKKYRAAREKFEKALSEESDNSEVLFRLGQSLIFDGEAEAAVKYLKMAKSISPYESEVGLWLGRALFLKGDFKEAQAELGPAWGELKKTEMATLWFSETLVQLGQGGQALRLLENDAKTSPFHLQSLILAASLRLQHGSEDPQNLILAQKNIKLASTRLEDPGFQKFKNELRDPDLGVSLQKSKQDLSEEIQKLTKQIQDRLTVSSAQR